MWGPAQPLVLISPQSGSPSVRYKLGACVCTSDVDCPDCLEQSDKEGDHTILCRSKGERIARHNHIRDHLYHTAVCSAVSPNREDRAIIRGSDARPAGVLILYQRLAVILVKRICSLFINQLPNQPSPVIMDQSRAKSSRIVNHPQSSVSQG